MLNYIRAELYRTRKTSNNKIMWILGIAAIAIAAIAMKTFDPDNIPYRDNFYFGVARMVGSMGIFISILIMGASFKEGFEEKNYVERGFNRSNIIIGDLIVAVISTLVKAIGLTALTYLVSLMFKLNPEFTPHTFKNFSIHISFLTMAILVMNCGAYAIYNVTNKQGVSSILAFFMYMFLPQISGIFMHYDNVFGKICKLIVSLSPYKLFGDLSDYVIYGDNPINIKYFIAMLIINLVVFNLISLVAKNRKRY